MKSIIVFKNRVIVLVAPLVGAWIEIGMYNTQLYTNLVAPLVGAWIEIYKIKLRFPLGRVAPLVGAWIEILLHQFFPCLGSLSLLL